MRTGWFWREEVEEAMRSGTLVGGGLPSADAGAGATGLADGSNSRVRTRHIGCFAVQESAVCFW